MSDLIPQLDLFEADAQRAFSEANSEAALEQCRIQFLGAKQGRLKDLQAALGKVPVDQKPACGKRFNEAKNRVQALWDERKQALSRPKVVANSVDVTLPGPRPRVGTKHPITQTIEEFKEIMGRFGFSVATGPEVEDEFHNFDALNIPLDHPARDPLDNFYLSTAERGSGLRMLRSQTSTVQIRVMEKTPPPIRIVSVGRVYRPDKPDMTHNFMFHQMEGLLVGDDVTMAQLKTVLRLFAHAYLGHDVHIRFRPSFFPFTEPSVEVDMSMDATGSRWLEIGGAGMVDPNVLRAVGYDPEKVTGFAFGLGVERFCMRRHGVTDIRWLTTNDVAFLRQF